MKINSFGIVGGDERQKILAQSLSNDQHTVYTFALGKMESPTIKDTDLESLISSCNYIIFPVPVVKNDRYLNAPYHTDKIVLDDNFAKMMMGKRVFGGIIEKLYETSKFWEKIETFDYFKREELTVYNAVPTAEGAIEIAMRETKETLNHAKCLIAGYGRIGKVLAKMLHGLGANVTVCARKPGDLAWIDLMGYHAIHTEHICEEQQYSIIFNTIPALIFDTEVLARIPKNTLIIDLASAPGGIDYNSAEHLGIKVIQALSLPGKVAPKTAGEIIKKTIYNMLGE